MKKVLGILMLLIAGTPLIIITSIFALIWIVVSSITGLFTAILKEFLTYLNILIN